MDDLGTGRVPGIVSCSALKKAYRDRLRASRPHVALVYLKGTYELVDERLSRRKGHFMPRALLESQFATLEEPVPAEKAVVVPIHLSPRKVVERIVTALELRPGRPLR
jgi:carbohydrate kinase (thermoresistant glucokinase family)